MHIIPVILIKLYNYQAAMSSNINQQLQNTFGQSSSQMKTELARTQDKSLRLSENPQEIRFSRYSGEKDKKMKRKADSVLGKLRITAPLSFQHVSNFLNMISINERAFKDRACEESYFRSIFYTKPAEKVEVRKNALIIHLKTHNTVQCLSEKHKIQYLIQRYKSLGDQQFYQLALKLQKCFKNYSETNFTAQLKKCYQGEPLSRFIEAMQDKIYGCKVSPNKLVISRKLLQLLGEDMQNFALGICKYKTPMQEIISSEHYHSVINKSIEAIDLLCDFMQQKIDLQTLQRQSYLWFNDYLCSRNEQKIYCKIKLHMPTPLMNCLEVIQILNKKESSSEGWHGDARKRKSLIIDEVQEIRFRQAESLRHLASVQNNMLGQNKTKIASFIQKASLGEINTH